MKFETIDTDRLILRKLLPDDYQYLFEHVSREEVKVILGFKSDDEYNLEYSNYKKGYTSFNRSQLVFQLLLKDTNELIGECVFHNWLSRHSRSEIGYSLKQNCHKQKGYMTEALKVILQYGFQELNLNRIEACVEPNNEASINLIEKFNFIKEGLLKQHYFKNDQFEDSIIYALLKENWIQAQYVI